MERDSINWTEMNIPVLFRKIFIPTLMGMLMVASLSIFDGAFVGQGVGSDALAAVNIVSPFYLLTTGIGLMFGTGASIVASVHLARGNRKAADINMTQAFLAAILIMAGTSIIVMLNVETAARLLGSSDRLMPYVKDYMRWIIPALSFTSVMSIGLFIIRLDGSPKYAMYCNVVPGALNILLDWVFIFPLQMGIGGAALASAIAEFTGCVMVFVYMTRFNRTLHFYRLKLSVKSLKLTIRNIGYQAKLGASGMIGELAIGCMIFVGNYMFIRYLGEDGVAAFSVACYCIPLVFMVGNAISQSAQPIISYNYGAGLGKRVKQAFRLSLVVAAVFGILITLGGIFDGHYVISAFIPDADSTASRIANYGFPYLSVAFLIIVANVVYIGYLQSMERFKPATIFTLLRGFVLMIPAFLLLPPAVGNIGLWLAIPVSEAITFVAILCYSSIKNRKSIKSQVI